MDLDSCLIVPLVGCDMVEPTKAPFQLGGNSMKWTSNKSEFPLRGWVQSKMTTCWVIKEGMFVNYCMGNRVCRVRQQHKDIMGKSGIMF